MQEALAPWESHCCGYHWRGGLEKTTTHPTRPLSCCTQKDRDIHAWLYTRKRNQETAALVSLDPDATKLSVDQELKGVRPAPLLSWPGAEASALGAFQTQSTHVPGL